MKVIVHIGTEKTGTTSIQKFLYHNRRKLQKAGYHFIQSAGKTNHQAIPALCIRDDKFDDFFRNNGIDTIEQRNAYREQLTAELAAEINGVPAHIHTVIISSEHFHSRIRTEEEMDNVHSFLTQFFDDIRIVCYLREQATTCTSYYSTSLKSGGAISFEDFMRRCAPGNYYFNYFDMLGNWERCFGLAALDVSLFDRARFVKGDLLEDFASKIDPSLVGLLNTSIDSENESLTPSGQALVRAVNIVFPVRTARAEVGPVREKCRKLVYLRLKGKGQQLPLAKRQEIYESFRESNELLRQKLFPDIEVMFTAPTESDSVDIQITDAFLDAQVAVLGMLRKVGRGIVTSQELADLTIALGKSMDEITSGDIVREEQGNQVFLSRDDAEVLRRAALGYEKRNIEVAFKLMSLAERADSTMLGVSSRLEKFAREKDQPAKPRFFMRSYVDTKSPDWDPSKLNPDELFAWYKSFQQKIVGSMINGLTETWRTGVPDLAEGIQLIDNDGFTIIEAQSMEEAQKIAGLCPLLKLGGGVEVSSLVLLASGN